MENKGNLWTPTKIWKIHSFKGKNVVSIYTEKEENPEDKDDGAVEKFVKKAKKFLKNAFGQGNDVLEEDLDEGEAESSPFWKKEPNHDDYFTLGTTKGAKVLTATSEGGLEIAGNFNL